MTCPVTTLVRLVSVPSFASLSLIRARRKRNFHTLVPTVRAGEHHVVVSPLRNLEDGEQASAESGHSVARGIGQLLPTARKTLAHPPILRRRGLSTSRREKERVAYAEVHSIVDRVAGPYRSNITFRQCGIDRNRQHTACLELQRFPVRSSDLQILPAWIKLHRGGPLIPPLSFQHQATPSSGRARLGHRYPGAHSLEHHAGARYYQPLAFCWYGKHHPVKSDSCRPRRSQFCSA